MYLDVTIGAEPLILFIGRDNDSVTQSLLRQGSTLSRQLIGLVIHLSKCESMSVLKHVTF